MLAAFGTNTITLYIMIDGHHVRWRTIKGGPEKQRAALESAREIDDLAIASGGWSKARLLGLNPPEPVKLPGVTPIRVRGSLSQHDPYRGIRKVHAASSAHGLGATGVGINKVAHVGSRCAVVDVLRGNTK